MDQLRDQKDEAAQAMGRGQWPRALKLYRELSDREPNDGTWAMRAGDAARRMGQSHVAVIYYKRAAAAYKTLGFMVRAIAVGKMIEALEPGNDKVLRELDAAQQPPVKASAPIQETLPTIPNNLTLPPTTKTGIPTNRPGSLPISKPHGPPPIPKPSGPPPIPHHKGPPPIPKPHGPPLMGRLSGPILTAPAAPPPSAESIEIVFDTADDGIPIQDSDILSPDQMSSTGPSAAGEGSKLLGRLPSFPIFEVLPAGGFLSVVSRMKHRRFNVGEVIVRQGETGTSLYAIIDGEARVYLESHRDQPLATLTTGDVFGEMALVLDQPRAATVEANTELELFEMDRELMGEVVEAHPQLGEVVSRLIKRRLVENILTTAPLFRRLDVGTRQDLLMRFEVREVAAGTRLVEQNTACDGLYLIVSGHVYARQQGGDGTEPPKIVAILKTGQTFGAASMFDSRNVSPTSFEAPENAVVLRLPRSAFYEVISFYPPILEHLSEVAESQKMWMSSDQVPVV
jgi:CRP-like cAMP-binding protein